MIVDDDAMIGFDREVSVGSGGDEDVPGAFRPGDDGLGVTHFIDGEVLELTLLEAVDEELDAGGLLTGGRRDFAQHEGVGENDLAALGEAVANLRGREIAGLAHAPNQAGGGPRENYRSFTYIQMTGRLAL